MTRIRDLEQLDADLREHARRHPSEALCIANERESIRQQLRILRQAKPIALPPFEWEVDMWRVTVYSALGFAAVILGVHAWLR